MKSRVLFAFLLVSSLINPISMATSQGKAPLVCLAYDEGGPGDGSYNDAVQAGLKVASTKLTFTLETTVTSGELKDRKDRLAALVKKGCQIAIAVGSGYAATLKELSQQFPETQFAIINDATVDAFNVTSIVFADIQGAYLAGFAAALASKSGKVAMIGYSPQKEIFEKGFLPGAKAAKKSTVVSKRVISNSASTTTSALLRSGHDVIYLATTGSATDVFSAVVSYNRTVKSRFPAGLITLEPEQFLTVDANSKKFLLATVVKRVDLALVDLLTATLAGATLFDNVDQELGVYGYRYGIDDKSIEITLRSPALIAARSKINAASVTAAKLR